MGVTNLVTRVISGKGTLKVPPTSVGYRYQILDCELVRDSTNPYKNFSWNPPRSQYANITLLQRGLVVFVHRMEFPKQRFFNLPDSTGELLFALRCVQYSDLYSFSVILKQLGGLLITAHNPIADYAPVDLGWDEALVYCYSDCAIQISLTTEEYDSCSIETAPTPPTPPPSPPPTPEPPNKVQPGTPVSISPGYDGKDDGGNSVPAPIDVKVGTPTPTPTPAPTPTPVGTKCQKIRLEFHTFETNLGPPYRDVFVDIFGEWDGSYAPVNVKGVDGSNALGIRVGCRGIAACGDAGFYNAIYATDSGGSNKITSATLIGYTLTS